jgi:hypothetical protein
MGQPSPSTRADTKTTHLFLRGFKPTITTAQLTSYLEYTFGPVKSIKSRPNHPDNAYAEMVHVEAAENAVGATEHRFGMTITYNRFHNASEHQAPGEFDHL